MQVRLVTVNSLLDQIGSQEKPAFLVEYPGVFFLAMGFLSAELLRSKKANETSALSFGAHLRHDLAQGHPLAGCAFFLRGASEEHSEVTLGRSPKCQITVPDSTVSELHCAIMVTEKGVAAVDLDSRNGTIINMKRLAPGKPALLADEDILTVGRYSFQVLSSGTLYSALALLRSINE